MELAAHHTSQYVYNDKYDTVMLNAKAIFSIPSVMEVATETLGYWASYNVKAQAANGRRRNDIAAAAALLSFR